MDTPSSPPNRIAELREARGLSQRALAELAGMHWLTLAHLETGKSQLTTKRMSSLAAALKTNVSDLIIFRKNEIIKKTNTVTERLKLARLSAGYTSISSAIRKFGWKESAYRNHENGVRHIALIDIEIYAAAFETDPAWIAFGNGIHPDEKNDIYPTKGDMFLIEITSSKTVGSRIAAYRKYLNITQLELAKTLEISQTTIFKWENGSSPPADSLPRIAAAFNIKVLDLLGLGIDPEASLTTCLGPAHTEAFRLLHSGTGEQIGAGTAEREQARHTIIVLAERLKIEAARGLC